MPTYPRRPNPALNAASRVLPQQLISDAEAEAARELVSAGILPLEDFYLGRRRWSGPFNNPVQIEHRAPSPDPRRPELGRLKALRYTFNARSNDGIDWQNRAMSGGPNTSTLASAGFVQDAPGSAVAITAQTSTSAGIVTDTNAAITASTAAINQFIGCLLLYSDTTNSHLRAAHLVGNSASASSSVKWYFDAFFAPTDWSASVTTPANNMRYAIVPASSTLYVGLATNSGAQAASDHLIGNVSSGASAEIGSGMASAPVANGLGRAFAAAASNYSHTAGGASYQLKNVFTSSGSFTAVQQAGMFTSIYNPGDSASDLAPVGLGGGVMAFQNSFSSVNLASLDTLTLTWAVTY